MKTKAGTKPTSTKVADRIVSPRLIAVFSSVISLTIVAGYFVFCDKKKIDEISEKDETVYLSRTPEHAAESFLAALTDNDIERALRLCRGSAKNAVLNGSVFRLMETEAYPRKTRQLEKARFQKSTKASTYPADESRASVGTTPKGTTTRSSTARDQSTGRERPFPTGGFPRAAPKKRNSRFRLPEPLLFAVHESHRKGVNRIILIGTSKGKNTGRVYFRDTDMSLERSDSRWYVTRIRFK